jgi:glycosyltransferase involved in cell wall biosynthesis
MITKLCFVITGLSTGGAENMLLKLIEGLDRSRFSSMVISLTTQGEIGARMAALGIPVVTLGLRPSLPNPLVLLRLISLLRKFKPDIVQTWMYHADLLGGLAARAVGIRAVVWGIRHSDLSPARNKRMTLAVVQLCAMLSIKIPLRILSCSFRAKDVHVAAGYVSDKFEIIPNGFDLQRFVPDAQCRLSVRQELGLSNQTPLIGLIGRFDPQKNHLGFVEAARLVHRQLPEVHFLLAGTGVDASNRALISVIAKAGLSECFHLLGRRGDMPRLMAALDVLASSSDGEAFPNVLGEAMACAVPCVVTDVGDSADIVGETGRAAQAGDMVGLAARLVEVLVLSSEARYELGQAARQRIVERYEIGCVVGQYDSFYQSMVREVF